MCGLFGWNLKPGTAKAEKDTLRVLAISLGWDNDNRGGDSIGFLADNAIYKRMGEFRDLDFDDHMKMASCDLLLGHTRKATTGAKTVSNSHPFKHGRITGAHNGIVYNHKQLCEKYGRIVEVDSEHLFCHIDGGHEFKEISAYGAITYVDDAHPGLVFFGRFNGGSLHVATVSGWGAFWSSDEKHLDRALDLAGLFKEASWLKIKDGRLYRIDGNGLCKKVCTLDIDKPTYSASDFAYTSGSGGHYKSWRDSLYDDGDDYRNWQSRGSGIDPARIALADKRREDDIKALAESDDDLSYYPGETAAEAAARLLKDEEEAYSPVMTAVQDEIEAYLEDMDQEDFEAIQALYVENKEEFEGDSKWEALTNAEKYLYTVKMYLGVDASEYDDDDTIELVEPEVLIPKEYSETQYPGWYTHPDKAGMIHKSVILKEVIVNADAPY